MTITKNRVASIEYKLTNDTGEVIDSSDQHGPLQYMHGAGEIIPGLEQALEGRESGGTFQVTIEPEQAYGPLFPELVVKIPREAFGSGPEPELGLRVQLATQEGRKIIATIVEIGDEVITVDGNHPMAGKSLHFDVKVVDIRDATAEELSRGSLHEQHSCCGKHDHDGEHGCNHDHDDHNCCDHDHEKHECQCC